jgi:hypothetical protein
MEKTLDAVAANQIGTCLNPAKIAESETVRRHVSLTNAFTVMIIRVLFFGILSSDEVTTIHFL